MIVVMSATALLWRLVYGFIWRKITKIYMAIAIVDDNAHLVP